MAEGEFVTEVAAGAMKFSFRDKGMANRLANGSARLIKTVYATMEFYAPQVENYAKVNAPWTDRTGNARNGLAARAFQETGNAGIVLFHQVPYGIWLEVKNSGAYAIIMPTIDYYGPVVMRRLERVMDRTKF